MEIGKCNKRLFRIRLVDVATSSKMTRRGKSRAWVAWKKKLSSSSRLKHSDEQLLLPKPLLTRFQSAMESPAENNECLHLDRQVVASIRSMRQGAARAELHSRVTKRWLDAVEAQLEDASSPILEIQVKLASASSRGDLEHLLQEAEELLEWQAPDAQEIEYMGSKTNETLQAVEMDKQRALDSVKQLKRAIEAGQVAWLANLQDAASSHLQNVQIG